MEDEKGFPAPGTGGCALIFLAVFILFYFFNWMWLSLIWNIG